MITTNEESSGEDAKEEFVEQVLAALDVAKKAHALLPPLPLGVRPVHVRILNVMYRLGPGHCSRVSDINNAMGSALPNTTKFINEMVALNIVKKVGDESDKRVVLVQTTELGDQYTNQYVRLLHIRLAKAFSRIGTAECSVMGKTLRGIYIAMLDVCSEANFQTSTIKERQQ
jgi:DNA-binding MarR family transcriptional regulator